MSLRFTRRVSLIPGLRVNLSKSGASLSIGHRGAWYTVGHHRRRVSVGAPGTGLYWTENYPGGAPAPHGGHRAAFGSAGRPLETRFGTSIAVLVGFRHCAFADANEATSKRRLALIDVSESVRSVARTGRRAHTRLGPAAQGRRASRAWSRSEPVTLSGRAAS